MTDRQRIEQLETCVAGLIEARDEQDRIILVFGKQVQEIALLLAKLREDVDEPDRPGRGSYDGWLQPEDREESDDD